MPFTLSYKDIVQFLKIFDFINNFIYISHISDKVMNAVQDLWSVELEDKAMADIETPEEKHPILTTVPAQILTIHHLLLQAVPPQMLLTKLKI